MPDRKGKLLTFLSISFAILSCASTALISLPMPTQGLWLAAAGANEFTSWILITGLLGFVIGIKAGYRQKSIVCFVAAAACAVTTSSMIMLTLQIFETAHKYQTKLSVLENLTSSPTSMVTKTADVTYKIADGMPLKLDVYSDADRNVNNWDRNNKSSDSNDNSSHRNDNGSDRSGSNLDRKRSNSDRLHKSSSSKIMHPAVVILHGGSWRRGHKSDLVRFDNWLAGNNYTVFEIDYRLATSGCHFPKQLEDVESAITWVEKHGEEYNADSSQIILFGRSAGAQLALIAAYKNPSRVKGVASYYAPTDLVWDYHHPCVFDIVKTRPTIENFLGGTPATVPSLYENASAIKQLTSTSPPTLILQGGRDQVVGKENADFLADKLKTCGVPFEYVYLPWANHGFDFRLSGWSSQISNSALLRFLQRTLAEDKSK